MDGESSPPPVTTAPPLPTGETPPAPPAALPLSQGLTDAALKSHQGLGRYKDVDSLAKGYLELEKKLGERSGVKPLTPESTPEDIAAYRAAMGVPESWEKYEVETPDYPEAVAPTAESVAAFRQTAHALHLTPAQLDGIFQWHAQAQAQLYTAQQEAQQAQNAEGMEVLRGKYGANAVPMVKMAQEYVKRRFGPDAFSELDGMTIKDPDTGQQMTLGSSPTFLQILVENARYTGHDQFVIADARNGFMSKESALQRQQELWGQRWRTADGSAERKAIDDEISRLGPIAHGD